MGGIASIFGGGKNSAFREYTPIEFDPKKWMGMFGDYTNALDTQYQQNFKTGSNAIQDLMSRRGMLYGGPAAQQLGNFATQSANENYLQKNNWLQNMLGNIAMPAYNSQVQQSQYNNQNYNQWAQQMSANKNQLATGAMGVLGAGLGSWMSRPK